MTTISTRVEQISPEVAEHYLTLNLKNRSLSKPTVRRYAKDMRAGAWQLNGEPLIFSDRGTLLNGQHTLTAVVESGATIQKVVVRGVAEETFRTMDAGAPRNAGHVLGIEGHANANQLAAAAKFLTAFLAGDPPSRGTSTRAERLRTVSEHPGLDSAVQEVSDWLPKSGRVVSVARLAFVYYLATKVDRPAARAFTRQVATGEGVMHGSPVTYLRQRLTADLGSKTRLSTNAVIYLLMRAWRAFYCGHDLSTLQLPRTKLKAKHFYVAPNASDRRAGTPNRWYVAPQDSLLVPA